MPLIAPFRGLRYNPLKIREMDSVVTPPYDVINERDQAAFRKKNPYNMIHLDLSKENDPAGNTDRRYQEARDKFAGWQAEQVLIREQEPAIYLYNIDYNHPNGRRLTRKGLVCLVKLSDFSEGRIRPHELTFAKVTNDRLRLLDTCRAQFSQIFSLYPDPAGAVTEALEAAGSAPACTVMDLDGGRHSIRPVTDIDAIRHIQTMFKDKTLYIADGHHRYTTALQLRELAEQRHGTLPENSPCNYTMMYLSCMEDPGLTVLPTHRLLRMPSGGTADGTRPEALLEKIETGFAVEEIKNGSRETLLAEVLGRMEENVRGTGNSPGATKFGLYHAGEDRCFLLTLKAGVMEKFLKDSHPPALRQLDVVALSDLLLEHILNIDRQWSERDKLIDYFSDPDEALDVAVKELAVNNGAAPIIFLMNPTLVSQVKQVADEGLVMPHKSTFFYPKIITGLVIYKLDEVPHP